VSCAEHNVLLEAITAGSRALYKHTELGDEIPEAYALSLKFLHMYSSFAVTANVVASDRKNHAN
jgi:hypothetical protein